MPHHSKQSQRSDSMAASGYVDTAPTSHLSGLPPTDGRVATGMEYLSRATDLTMMSDRNNVFSFPAPHPASRDPSHSDMHWTSDSAPSSSVDSSEHTVEPASFQHDSYHRVPQSPPEGLKQVESREQAPSSEESKPQLERSPSREIASVLLLAVAATSGKELALAAAAASDEGNDVVSDKDADTVDTRNYPLKKRKVYNDIRREPDDGTAASGGGVCHVSPLSHGSKSGGTDRSDARTPEATVIRTSRVQDEGHRHAPGTDGTAPGTTLPLAHVMVPHFPSALHWLLTEAASTQSLPTSECTVDHSLLQWVSHGQAFRIVRWDAFYRQVLPTFFGHLSIETADGRQVAVGSMDAFLWHLAAWGFDEIKDGPDVGAFAHTFFRRGHPQLCYDMRFAPPTDTKFVSNASSDSRSILRVPSLNSTAGSTDTRHLDERDDDIPSSSDADRSSQSSVSSVFQGPSRRHSFVVHKGSSTWTASPSGGMRSLHQPPVFVNYRPDDMNVTPDGSWHFSNTATPPGPWNGQHLTPPQQNGSAPGTGNRSSGMPPYSPIRIRSARGARRLSINGNGPHSAPHNSPVNNEPTLPPRGFPVSNRGMGRRNVASNLSAKSNVTSHELVMLSKPEAEKGSVDTVTGATKMEEVKLPRSVVKRKLPLMSSTPSIESNAGES